MKMSRLAHRWMLWFVLAACAAPSGAADDSRNTDKPREKAPTTKRSAQTHTVTIKNSRFSPAALTLKAGATVIWKNDDDKDHTVVAADKSFKSDNISTDGEFEHMFKKPGTIKYGCKYHPRESGVITVQK